MSQEARLRRIMTSRPVSEQARKRFDELKAAWDALSEEEKAERRRPSPEEVIYRRLMQQWESPQDMMFQLTVMEFADEIIEDLRSAGYIVERDLTQGPK